MKVTYTGPDKAVHIPGVGKFDTGKPIDLPDDVAKALVKTHPHYKSVKADVKKEGDQ